MINIIFVLCLFLSASSMAEGPKIPRHKEPTVQLEFENVYQDLRHLNNGFSFLSGPTDINTRIAPSTGTVTFDSSWVMYVATGSTQVKQWVKIGGQ